jgi:predicted GNAT family acetyltransferase
LATAEPLDSWDHRRRIAEVSSLRHDAIDDLQQLVEAASRLRADLRAKESIYRRTVKSLERGTGVAQAMKLAKADEARRELTGSLDDFEYFRHRSRLSLTAAGLDEGMTIGQVGRAWGISRQLAARYAKEARHSA